MEFWVILVGFWQWKNGQKWKTTVNSNSDILKGFWMPEHWKQCKNQCFGPTLCLKTCKLQCFWLKRGGNRSPGRPGLRMAAKLFEIEMQITCTNVKKHNSYLCKLLSPCDGPKKTLRCGRPPHAKRGEYQPQPFQILCCHVEGTHT